MSFDHRRAIPRRSPQISGRRVLLSRAASRSFSVLLLVALVACVSATPQKRAAQGLDTLQTSVDIGMKTAASLYKEGRVYDPAGAWRVVSPADVLVTDETWTKLATLHEKYRLAGKAAAIAIRAAGPNLKDPAAFLFDVQQAASEVMALVTLLQQGRLR